MTDPADVFHRRPCAGPAVGRVWKFWGTLLWGIAIYAALTAAQIGVALVVLHYWNPTPDGDAISMETVFANGIIVSLSAIAGAPAVLAVIALAVHLAGARFSDYLALTHFKRRDLLIGIAAIAIYTPLIALLATLTGREMTPPVVVETYRTALDSGALLLLVFAVAVVAPVSEEFAVRGFLFRGWAVSPLGVGGTIVLSAALWAVIHVQYEWFFVGEIFGAGLMFGYLRSRSGSTWLTVILHGIYNLAALAQAAVLDRMG